MTFQNIIQVAGIIDLDEAELAISSGVELLGFPLRLPVHKEDLSEQEARSILSKIKGRAEGVLITYMDSAREIAEFCEYLGLEIVQLHGDIKVEQLALLKNTRPDISIIKSLVVHGDNRQQLEETVTVTSGYVDAFITDTFDPLTGASGATGKTHDWEISSHLVQLSDKPVILAGGLNPDNVARAITQVRPAGVDVHTGIETTSGRKDPLLLKRFVLESRRAFNEHTRLIINNTSHGERAHDQQIIEE